MGEKRKLQAEIDRTLKKVQEGVDVFQETWEKVNTAANANQKEKYEADLKKEIKKLQRLRDQIKTWAASNDVKDKDPLYDARKLIEQQMEKFKIVERETKTKAYSKEGLGAAQKLDPAQKEKEDIADWLNETIQSLRVQIEMFESEREGLTSTRKRKMPVEKQDRYESLTHSIDLHNGHIEKLETIFRLWDNDRVPLEKIKDLQDFLNRYVNDELDPAELEIDFYEDLNLEELVDQSVSILSSGQIGTVSLPTANQKDDDGSTGSTLSTNMGGSNNMALGSPHTSISPSPSPHAFPKDEDRRRSKASSEERKTPLKLQSGSSKSQSSTHSAFPSSTTSQMSFFPSSVEHVMSQSYNAVAAIPVTQQSLSGVVTSFDRRDNSSHGGNTPHHRSNADHPIFAGSDGTSVTASFPSSTALPTSTPSLLPSLLRQASPISSASSPPSTITITEGTTQQQSSNTDQMTTTVATTTTNVSSVVSSSSSSVPFSLQQPSRTTSASPEKPSSSSSTSSSLFTSQLQQQLQLPSSLHSSSSSSSATVSSSSSTAEQVPPSSSSTITTTTNQLQVGGASITTTTTTATSSAVVSSILTSLQQQQKQQPSQQQTTTTPSGSSILNSIVTSSQSFLTPPNQQHLSQQESTDISSSLLQQLASVKLGGSGSTAMDGGNLELPEQPGGSTIFTTATVMSEPGRPAALSELAAHTAATQLANRFNSSSQRSNTDSGKSDSRHDPAVQAAAIAALQNHQQQQNLLLDQVQDTRSMTLDSPIRGVAVLGPVRLDENNEHQQRMLEVSSSHLPQPSDTDRVRLFLPRQPHPIPSYYPSVPPPQLETPEFYQKLSPENLFFLFYYMEGTKAQYFAAKALKKQSWRFHTKYMRWFQRHEEPLDIKDDYEKGTYIYWDYERWMQQKKENFTFEYKYLEDRDLS